MSELVGVLDSEEARPSPPAFCTPALEQPVLAHQPLHALA
jgi:hypothetical protein